MENRWEPIWFEEGPLPHPDYAVDESGKVNESSMTEGSGTIYESEIAESDEADFGESEENCNGQEEDSGSPEYADSCSGSNDHADVGFY